ncbi:MAG: RNA 2',3'-cyclic phosphodiesterase [Candidatus Iainarchaeum archaeon]|uniref:RNA 2',3'-cyclic phosphodiesterase n=1 Tax=Candidatus Iainarchaeum sp. TaxID=3101447 RepID=A0A497JHX3_9ARCH|nr:MAG: RNA 2',3'-cyclic phosphodiesterase [Candidatus Diapherotrites archaeon]
MARLFLAINLPQDVRAKIFETFSKKLKRYEGLKVVPKDNLHITLLFLGEVPDEKVEEIKNKISKIKFPKFNIKIGKIGHFGNRVVWIYADSEDNLLRKLSVKLQEALQIHDERFHPHITLCRARKPGKKIKYIVESLSKINFKEEITVEKFSLMRSFLKSPAPEYKEIFSVNLT